MIEYISENDIRRASYLLIEKYQVPKSVLVSLIGKDEYKILRDMLIDLEEGEPDLEQLARIVITNKGPRLFAGSSDEVRKLREHLLRQLSEESLYALYERNPKKGSKITTVSYMISPLVQKKWVQGKGWARDFVKTLGFPVIFSGIQSVKESRQPVQDIEPRKTVPPLVSYQQDLKDKMLQVLNQEGDAMRCVVTLPTGGGKTRVAVESFIDWMQPRFNEGKYLIWIAQGEELCEQAIACIADMWQDREFPESLRVYRYFGSSELRQQDLVGGAVVASIQQIHTRIKNGDVAFKEILKDCGAMIIDEAHHATADMYTLLFDYAKEVAGEELFPVCGLTATPGRSNNETMNLVDQFEAYLIHPTLPEDDRYKENPLRYFRDQGYLAQPQFILHQDGQEIDLGDEQIAEHHDLTPEFLRELAEDNERNKHIIEYLLAIDEGCSVLVYACTVQHAEQLSLIMNATGRKSAVISAETPKQLRRMYIASFKAGEIEFLFNYGVLTTGFDAPKTDHIVILRPTTSIILYEQMVGRGLRGSNFGGTDTCKIIDFSGNIKRHGSPLAYHRFVSEWEIEPLIEKGVTT